MTRPFSSRPRSPRPHGVRALRDPRVPVAIALVGCVHAGLACRGESSLPVGMAQDAGTQDAPALGLDAVADAAEPPENWVEIDTTAPGSRLRNLRGVNKAPRVFPKGGGTSYDVGALFRLFGIGEARTHDIGLDVCEIWKPRRLEDASKNPAEPVTSCKTAKPQEAYHLRVCVDDESRIDDPTAYDFSRFDEVLRSLNASGTRVYLRLGESYGGPNDVCDPSAYARVATNIYRHAIGDFGGASVVADIARVEVMNEPDGNFWAGDSATLHTLVRSTIDGVRAASVRLGKAVAIGGPGFTDAYLTTSTKIGNPANGFVEGVGKERLDFLSVHLYGACANAALASEGLWLRSLRSHVDALGLANTPLHLSEWNVGLGQQCGEAYFAEPRVQSYVSGMLTLLQDEALLVHAAHYYSAIPNMAMFGADWDAGTVEVRPSAWAFYAHAALGEGRRLRTEVCSPTCVEGTSFLSRPFYALSAEVDGGGTLTTLTNDGSTDKTILVRWKGLTLGTTSLEATSFPSTSQTVSLATGPAGAALTTESVEALLSKRVSKPVEATERDGAVEAWITVPKTSAIVITSRP